jgi:predicted outer membrane repeat protein
VRKQGRNRIAVASGTAVALGAIAAGSPAEAATFNVTNLNDSGAGSLRQAIEDANGAAGADTILFQAGLTGTIVLTTGQLSITDSVDLQGPGAAALAVSGNNASRVFYLYNNAALIDVTLSGLTITGGNASIGAGIVDFDENLTLDQVTVTGNSASGDGGGLWADGFNMTLTIRDSTISGNTSGDDGGGIYVEDTGAPLLIQRTVITGNDAADDGGGVYLYDPDDDVTIEDSTISGNSAGDAGGGIYLYSPDDGELTIRGTTISGNSAQRGGGIFLYSPDHGGSIENSTISGNQATAGDGGGIYLYNLYNFALHHVTVAGNSASGTGGGIFGQSSSLPIDNSIVANNTAGINNDLGNGIDGGFDASFDLIEAPGTANITDGGGNIFNQDPQLGPLQNNGGPAQTHLPAATSPVIDAGNSAFTVDQRGQARPVGAAVDIGSVEVAAAVPGTIQLMVSALSVNENGVTVTITATRTGGADGAVSVSYATSPGTATSPADFLAALGTLNWADQDTASKSFQVTIVNDTLDEPDETFTAALSNPTGGAALGATTTVTVTIIDDDTAAIVEVPTLGDVGRILLCGLVGLTGFLLLHRKGIGAAAVIISLLLGGATAVSAAPAKSPRMRAAILSQIQVTGDQTTIRLQDGTTILVDLDDLEVKDRRRKSRGQRGAVASFRSLSGGQAVVVKVRPAGKSKGGRVLVQIFDDLDQARSAVAGGRK